MEQYERIHEKPVTIAEMRPRIEPWTSQTRSGNVNRATVTLKKFAKDDGIFLLTIKAGTELGSIQLPIQRVQGVKLREREGNHS
jgi:hypothetical protein